MLIGVIAPSFLLGYCVRWMMEEQTKVKQINTNKQLKQENEKLLKEINRY